MAADVRPEPAGLERLSDPERYDKTAKAQIRPESSGGLITALSVANANANDDLPVALALIIWLGGNPP